MDDSSARPWFRTNGWYKQEPGSLDGQIKTLLDHADYDGDRRPALGILVPHAGLSFSGATQAEAYRRVRIPDTVVLLTPKHHKKGASPAIWNEGPFLIPGHALHVDHDMLDRLLVHLPDEVPHDRESWLNENNHPMEMQLPFVSTIHPDVQIVPVTFMDDLHNDFTDFDIERVNAWGRALADFVDAERQLGNEVLIIASTDLIHHQPKTVSDVQDREMMRLVGALDVEGLHRYVVSNGVTICGEIPTAILMSTIRELNGEAQVVRRTTSAEESCDESSVVGYGSAVFSERD